LCGLLFPSYGWAQQTTTVVFLKDKAGTAFTTTQPEAFLSLRSVARRAKFGIAITERDLPVSATYLSALKAAGLKIGKASRWLNAVPVFGDTAIVNSTLASFDFVKEKRLLTRLFPEKAQGRGRLPASGIASVVSEPDYGLGAKQVSMLGIDKMHAAGLTGKGVLVAVLDGGFQRVDVHTAFEQTRSREGFKQVKNLIEDVPRASPYDMDAHGGYVLSCIGGYYPGKFVGGAYDADFALYATEDVPRERPIETFYWVLGAEQADSIGADILNSSLGYNFFDNRSQDFTLAQIDGQTTLCTQGANMAAEAGIVVVVSAGNEGRNVIWSGKITAPGDALKAITVGAVQPDSLLAGFSGKGIGARPYIKPDAVAQGTAVWGYSPVDRLGTVGGLAGTSFSSPLLTGLLAGMMQRYPQVPPSAWQNALHATGSRSASPDTVFGYGIPNYTRLNTYLAARYGQGTTSVLSVYPNPAIQGQDLQLTFLATGRAQQLEIINMLGQKIASQTIDAGQTFIILQTKWMATGQYLVRLSGGEKTGRSKLLLVR